LVSAADILHGAEAELRQDVGGGIERNAIHQATDKRGPWLRACTVAGAVHRVQDELQEACRPDRDIVSADADGEHRTAKEGHGAQASDQRLRQQAGGQSLIGKAQQIEAMGQTEGGARSQNVHRDVEPPRPCGQCLFGRVGVARDQFGNTDQRTQAGGCQCRRRDRTIDPWGQDCCRSNDRQHRHDDQEWLHCVALNCVALITR
jgi:hypothetical protein